MKTAVLVAVSLAVGCTTQAGPDAGPEPAAPEPPAPAPASADIEAPFEPGSVQKLFHAETVPWAPCPDALGLPCEMAVLEGDPRSDKLFTIRLRTTEPFVVPPHHHPGNERVTVLDGALHVGFGDVLDKDDGTRFETGAYYVNARGAHHYVWSEEPMTIQITGLGPWKIIPVETAAN